MKKQIVYHDTLLSNPGFYLAEVFLTQLLPPDQRKMSIGGISRLQIKKSTL